MLLSCGCTALLARIDFGVLMQSYLDQHSMASRIRKLQAHVKNFRDRLQAAGSDIGPAAVVDALRHSTADLDASGHLSMDLAVMEAVDASVGSAATGQVRHLRVALLCIQAPIGLVWLPF
jgi:hypothetical protein